MDTQRHIAIIPGRAGSKGLPGKNRIFFSLTVDFIRAADFFDRVIVSSDDPVLLEMARDKEFETRQRPAELASDEASIKQTFEDIVANVGVAPMDYLWLIFIPLVYKNVDDFLMAKGILDNKTPSSLCSFIPAQSHPYYYWRIDTNSGKMERYIDHDLYRRQDLPDAWEEYPYLCALRADAVERSNASMICSDTYPVIFDQPQADLMVDVDEVRDFSKWEQTHPLHFKAWRDKPLNNDEYQKWLKMK